MKYLKFTIIFLVFTLVVYNVYDFDLQTETQNYNVTETNVENIDINVSNSVINIEPTTQNDILIERIYSERNDTNKTVYFDYEEAESKIYIGEYLINNQNKRPNQTINIKVPNNVNYLNVSVNGVNNSILIDGVSLNNLMVTDENKLIVKAYNSYISSSEITGKNLIGDIADYNGTNLSLYVDNLDMTMENVNAENTNITATNGTVNLTNNGINNFLLNSDSVVLNLSLGSEKSYNIKSNKEINSHYLTKKSDYEYTYNESDASYNYDITTNDQIKIKE